MKCGKIWELCTTFAANPQVSALPRHICQDHDVARFERRRHGPGRPVGPPERKTKLRFADPEGGRAGISRSPASRRRAQARGTFSNARRSQVQRPIVPGFDLCPGCGRGRRGFIGGLAFFISVEPGRLQERCQVCRLSARDVGVPGPASLTPLLMGKAFPLILPPPYFASVTQLV